MLNTAVAGIELGSCVFNASGPRTSSIEMLEKIARSGSALVLSKSATLLEQAGNPMPRFIKEVNLGPGCHGSMNSEGLPNKGINYYISDEAVSKIKATDKPYFISLSGLKLEDNLVMLERVCLVAGVDAIELNLACPNIPGKPTISYDFEQMEDVLNAVTGLDSFRNSNKKLGVKLAPYFDFSHLKRAAGILNAYADYIDFVVCINTIGNALFVDIDNEMSVIAPKGGYGGLGGGFVKHTALANVRKLYELLNPNIDIIGVGGIATGEDAFKMILCGAKAVQVGTKHWTEGPTCFERIANELKTIMIEKGYSSIEEFRGKLKPYARKGRKPTNVIIDKSNNCYGWVKKAFSPLFLYAVAITVYLFHMKIVNE